MLTRALIVMLVVLNLGVATWWMWRPAPASNAADIAEPSGIARLQLLQERKDIATRARAAATPATAQAVPAAQPAAIAQDTPSPVAAAQRCFRLGPFADEPTLAAAGNALQPLVAQVRTQPRAPDRGRGWRVIVPPSVDRATANALAERIKLAGFQDLFVIGEGADANAIALGRFSNEERAQAHVVQLRDAGFAAARAEPLGGTKPMERWLLVMTTANFDVIAARRASGATQASETDCRAMR
jgi:cell division septation protein DedD